MMKIGNKHVALALLTIGVLVIIFAKKLDKMSDEHGRLARRHVRLNIRSHFRVVGIMYIGCAVYFFRKK